MCLSVLGLEDVCVIQMFEFSKDDVSFSLFLAKKVDKLETSN